MLAAAWISVLLLSPARAAMVERPIGLRSSGATPVLRLTPSLAPLALKLSEGTPAQVRLARQTLAQQSPQVQAAVLAQAESAISQRIQSALAVKHDYDFRGERVLSAYDDQLRLLSLRGLFDGQTVYPISGADYLPARWGRVDGLNWDDHRPLYKEMMRTLDRPDLARGLQARWHPVDNVFRPKEIQRALAKTPEGTPRTLLLKHADGYSSDSLLESEADGVFSGRDLKGVLYYRKWLDFLFKELLTAGDHVVLLSRDAAAVRRLKASGRFVRVKLRLPSLKSLPAELLTIIHLGGNGGQALYSPNDIQVWRKKR